MNAGYQNSRKLSSGPDHLSTQKKTNSNISFYSANLISKFFNTSHLIFVLQIQNRKPSTLMKTITFTFDHSVEQQSNYILFPVKLLYRRWFSHKAEFISV